MSIANTVRANAQYHSHLLSQIGELDYVPSALENQRPYIQELEQQKKVRVPQSCSLIERS